MIIIFLTIFSTCCSYSREVKSYIEIRDKNLIRQSKRLSCGSAALATIMKYYLNFNNFDEKTSLNFLASEDSESSFLDLQNIANEYNIKSVGLLLPKNIS